MIRKQQKEKCVQNESSVTYTLFHVAERQFLGVTTDVNCSDVTESCKKLALETASAKSTNLSVSVY